MNEKLLYQIRVYFSSEFSKIFNSTIENYQKILLNNILVKHKAELLSQYDGFMGYVREAENNGVGNYPLYQWTKDCLEDENKVLKYKNSFTVYINNEAVYVKCVADKIEKNLKTIVDGNLFIRISKHDTNPINNPQMPKKYVK